jgi:hypothetical protein
MGKYAFGTALLAGLVAASAAAQEYTLRIKSMEDVGVKVRIKSSHATAGSIKVIDASGKVLQQLAPNQTEEEDYTETILEKGERAPQKYRQTYRTARTVEGQGEKKASHPYIWQGRALEYELRGGKYTVTPDGEPTIPDEVLKTLAARANQRTTAEFDKVFDPGKPVAVGDRWSLSRKLLTAFKDEGELDLERSKGTGKLVKVYDKDGKRFGVIAVDLQLAFKTLRGTPFDPPALSTLHLSLDTPIDGSSTEATIRTTGRFTGTKVLEQKGQKLSQQMSLDMSSTIERSVSK